MPVTVPASESDWMDDALAKKTEMKEILQRVRPCTLASLMLPFASGRSESGRRDHTV